MGRLDDLDAIGRFDRVGMLDIIGSFPEQCRQARKIGSAVNLPRAFRKRYDNIVCTGLGGSAIGADIMRSYILGESPTPLFVNRGYALPGFVTDRSLVIASSYSGDTEETLSSYKDARCKGAKIIAITSGGEVKSLAEKDGFPVVTIPSGLPPRCALGYSFFPLLVVLAKLGIVSD